jgi:hypothetical protein
MTRGSARASPALVEKWKSRLPPSALKPTATAMASIRVDLPLPFSPTRKVTCGCRARVSSFATAGTEYGYRSQEATSPGGGRPGGGRARRCSSTASTVLLRGAHRPRHFYHADRSGCQAGGRVSISPHGVRAACTGVDVWEPTLTPTTRRVRLGVWGSPSATEGAAARSWNSCWRRWQASAAARLLLQVAGPP